jgi:hypothetical protein
MPNVKFTVTASNTGSPYWIAANHKDVPIDNGAGTVALPTGTHLLVWWFDGNPGDTLSILGEVSGTSVVEVKSTIPDGETSGAGKKRFQLK